MIYNTGRGKNQYFTFIDDDHDADDDDGGGGHDDEDDDDVDDYDDEYAHVDSTVMNIDGTNGPAQSRLWVA